MTWWKTGIAACLAAVLGGLVMQTAAPIPAAAQGDDPTPTPTPTGTPELASFIDADDLASSDAGEAVPTISASRQPQATANPDDPVTILYFYADWCTNCDQQEPILDAITAQYGEQLRLIEIDTDQSFNQPMVQQHGVRAIPHMVVLDQRRRTVEVFTGVTSQRTLERTIDNILLRIAPLLDEISPFDYMR